MTTIITVTVIGSGGWAFIPPSVPGLGQLLSSVGAIILKCTGINEGSGSFDLTLINPTAQDSLVSVDYWITDSLNKTIYTGLLDSAGKAIRLAPSESRTFTVHAILNRIGEYTFHAKAKANPSGNVMGSVSQAFTAGFWDIYTYTLILVLGIVTAAVIIYRRRPSTVW